VVAPTETLRGPYQSILMAFISFRYLFSNGKRIRSIGFKKGMTDLVANLITLGIEFLCPFVHKNHLVVFVYQKGRERKDVQRPSPKG
jgi:hypothetical protein